MQNTQTSKPLINPIVIERDIKINYERPQKPINPITIDEPEKKVDELIVKEKIKNNTEGVMVCPVECTDNWTAPTVSEVHEILLKDIKKYKQTSGNEQQLINPVVIENKNEKNTIDEMSKDEKLALKMKLAEDIKKIKETKKDNVVQQLNPFLACQKLLKHKKFILCNNKLYFFNEICYLPLKKPDIFSLINDFFKSELREIGKPNFIKDVCEFLYMESSIKQNYIYSPELLAFKNGILKLSNFDFYKDSDAFFKTNFIDCVYNPEFASMPCPVFDNFLCRVTGNNKILIKRMWQILAYFLSDSLDAKKFLLLSGPSNTGKSVFCNLLKSFFNDEFVSAIELCNLGGKFSLGDIVGKKLNICADLSADILSKQAIAKLKMLTSPTDILQGEAKYENIFYFMNTCKFVFATNHALKLENTDMAFIKRILIMQFNFPIEKSEQDFRLPEKLQAEKKIIANKAITFFPELAKNNFVFEGDDEINKNYNTFCESNEESCLNASVTLFSDKCIEVDEESFTPTKSLFEDYKNFCNEKKLLHTNDISGFSRVLKEIFGEKITSERHRVDEVSKNPCSGYSGIKLK